MNTRTVDARTVWALLAMEAGLALPIISLPTQGDRIPGLLGPLLILALLPLGHVASRLITDLRDPSWRMLGGIGAALLARAIVSAAPEAGPSGIAVWLGHNVAAAAIGIGLWWRGAMLTAAEPTPADVRLEFSVLAVCMVGLLALVRPFVLADPLLLGLAVGLFAAGGLLATTFARQDAAQVSGRALGATMCALPIAIAVVLVGVLQPALLGAAWTTLGDLLLLVLTPIGLVLAWLASLLPRGAPAAPPSVPPRPTNLTPDLARLAAMQDEMSWLSTVIVVVLLTMISLAALLVVRLMLDHWLAAPPTSERGDAADLLTEHSGTPRGDARALFAWLVAWLRQRLVNTSRTSRSDMARGPRAAADTDALNAWTAYERLLVWASDQGLGRRPVETTGELRSRLSTHAPDAASAVDLVTTTYEEERYGNLSPAHDRVQRLRAALNAFRAGPR